MGAPLAYVAFLLDDSGSMSAKAEATIAAYNAYIETLKETKGAEIRFSLWKFGGNGLASTPVQRNAPIQDSVMLSTANYNPNDGTQLYWALVQLIQKTEEDLKQDKNPRKVVICIQTDGQSAKGYVDGTGSFDGQSWSMGKGYKAVEEFCGELVRKKQSEGWEFVFMAAKDGQFDFYNVACNELGIPKENVMVYQTDEKSTVAAFSAAAWNIGSFSSGRASHASFTK